MIRVGDKFKVLRSQGQGSTPVGTILTVTEVAVGISPHHGRLIGTVMMEEPDGTKCEEAAEWVFNAWFHEGILDKVE